MEETIQAKYQNLKNFYVKGYMQVLQGLVARGENLIQYQEDQDEVITWLNDNLEFIQAPYRDEINTQDEDFSEIRKIEKLVPEFVKEIRHIIQNRNKSTKEELEKHMEYAYQISIKIKEHGENWRSLINSYLIQLGIDQDIGNIKLSDDDCI